MTRVTIVMVIGLLVVRSATLAYSGELRRRPLPAVEARREARIDQREANQKRRIDHGIQKGYLTSDELTRLEAEQKSVADLEAGLKADGKLTVGEMKQLRTVLNTASVHIWAEKHDTEGKQMPAYRLGKNVFAKSELTDKLEQADLSGAEARQIVHEFQKTLVLKHKLASGDLTADQRSKLQAEYNDLLNKYFETRDAAPAKATGAGG